MVALLLRRSPAEPACSRCCTHIDDLAADGGGYPIRFAVRSLGWVEMKDEELNAEHSGKAVNRCIVGLSVGRNDVNDVVGRWGDVSIRFLFEILINWIRFHRVGQNGTIYFMP